MKIRSRELYDACGNNLLLVHLEGCFSFDDERLRRELRSAGLACDADSVLLVTGDPLNASAQGYHLAMEVFEPRGRDPAGLPGSWSTMCGNGIRSVGCYLRDSYSGSPTFAVRTRSGTIHVDVLSDNQFNAYMGEFTQSREDLSRYIRDFDFRWIRDLLDHSLSVASITAGLNGYPDAAGRIDGEPQLLIFIDRGPSDFPQLVKVANEVGGTISSNREVFPREINLSLAMMEEDGEEVRSIACAFERGVEYVTPSSGTAATAIGSSFLSRNPAIQRVSVQMPGGQLQVSRSERGYLLRGPAIPIRLR
jgi:diaminopimelate epimerase